MNAPYDGDRGQGAGGDPGGRIPPTPPSAQDPYVQDAYNRDPYWSQDLSAQDPVTEALYDRASHPPPPPGTYPETHQLYQQPPTPQNAPDPRVWAQTPPPQPTGPTRQHPNRHHPTTTHINGHDHRHTRAR
ncbi:murein biosynthesis integral membrane protein MurJ, partial [Streptomyces scopuliridis]